MNIKPVSADYFRLALDNGRIQSERIAQATSKPEDMPDSARYFLSDDNLSGFGISTDNILIGLFSIIKGRGRKLVGLAIEFGADNLDCFDGFLPEYYRTFGFVETSREPNWTIGEPDIVFMALV